MIGVLGATGRVGGAVVTQLTAAGHEAVALVRDPAAELPLPARRADLRDPVTLAAALDDVDRLLLITPHGPDQDLLEAAAIDAAAAAGVTRIVKLSGGAATLGPNGLTTTGVAHWRGEQRIEATGLEFVFLRPSFYVQNLLQTAAPVVAASRMLLAPMGRAPIAMVDVRDVAACAVAALTGEAPQAQAWSLTGPRGVTYAQLGRLLGVRYVDIPAKLAARSLRRQGAGAWEVEHALRMAAALSAGSAAATSPAVAQVLGRPPRTVEAFLDEHRAAFSRR